MDDVRLGNTLRVLRIRKHLRQSDVARRAGVSRQLIGRVEAGSAGRYPLDTMRAIANALGARIDTQLRYRGAELDRIMNAAHADLHRELAAFFDGLGGWTWLPEVTFSHYGERGIIDILAWHPRTCSLLIVELKTELVDPQELVAVMHRRARLGPVVARQQGWEPLTVSSWVVVRKSRAERRRLYQHERILRRAFPHDGRTMRRWLRAPQGTVSALSFWSNVTSGGLRPTTGATRRIRRTIERGQPSLPSTCRAYRSRPSTVSRPSSGPKATPGDKRPRTSPGWPQSGPIGGGGNPRGRAAPPDSS